MHSVFSHEARSDLILLPSFNIITKFWLKNYTPITHCSLALTTKSITSHGNKLYQVRKKIPLFLILNDVNETMNKEKIKTRNYQKNISLKNLPKIIKSLKKMKQNLEKEEKSKIRWELVITTTFNMHQNTYL